MKYLLNSHSAERDILHVPAAIAGNCPITYRVRLLPELAKLIEGHAKATNTSPETVIAEAVRAYMGAAE